MVKFLAILSLTAASVFPAAAAVTPGSLLIYYGWPSGINGTFEVTAAAAEFAAHDVVVLGDGLELDGHPDHANTVAILARIHATAATRVFGYVDLGVSTQNLSLAEIELRMDAWQAAGADGIFLDDFGYDFLVSRARQNAAVAAAHSRGLPVVANGWLPAQVFGSEPDATWNPEGAPTALGPDDYYLSESFLFAAGLYQDEAAWWNKALAVEVYHRQLGFGVLAVTTNDSGGAFDAAAFQYAWYGALLCGYEAVGWGEYLFAASSGSAPLRTPPAIDPGTAFRGSIQAQSPLYRRPTDAGWITLDTALHGGAFEPGWAAAPSAASGLQLSAAPNPFNPATTLSFTLDKPSRVSLEVFSLAGRRERQLLDGAPYGSGEHLLRFDAQGLASGTYLCRLTTAEGTQSRRLTLVR